MLPRPLHPAAWWVWALALGIAASRTSNPLLLGLILGVVGLVVASRRPDAAWAKGFRTYLLLGLVVVAVRVVLRALLGAQQGEHVLFTLPEISLPERAAGLRIGGPVSTEGVLAALYDGLRLATLIVCVGAANALADARRLLKLVPGALHSLGAAVTVTLSVAPQLVESGQRIRRARRLRGADRTGRHLVRQVAIPVMVDALDRSLLLAAAMDTRGYGRRAAVDPAARRLAGTAMVAGVLGACVGAYGALDGSVPGLLGLPLLVVGAALAAGGMLVGGRHVRRTIYRPDPWRSPEWLVVAAGLVAAIVVIVSVQVDPAVQPSLSPLRWPTLPLTPALGVLVAALPAWLAPPQEVRA
jgi:energy-coupling factor transport system permease protein